MFKDFIIKPINSNWKFNLKSVSVRIESNNTLSIAGSIKIVEKPSRLNEGFNDLFYIDTSIIKLIYNMDVKYSLLNDNTFKMMRRHMINFSICRTEYIEHINSILQMYFQTSSNKIIYQFYLIGDDKLKIESAEYFRINITDIELPLCINNME